MNLTQSRKKFLGNFAFPAVLLAICTAAFGLLIPWLGFYQDDWYQIWFGRAFGPSVFINYYAEERPFMAALYLLTTPIIGTAPLNWHIFALLMRWLAGLIVYWSLRQVWPKMRWLAGIAALLYVVYPGFRQQPAAVIYSHYFLQFGIQFASIGLMVLAVRAGRGQNMRRYALLLLLSLLGALVGIFTSEYFFGLELIRPLCLWWVSGEDAQIKGRQRVRQTLAQWAPFLGVLIAFLFWRLFIYQFPTYQPVFLQSAEVGVLHLGINLVRTIGEDILDMGLLAWVLPVQVFAQAGAGLPSTRLAMGLVVVCAACVWLYLVWLGRASARAAAQAPEQENTVAPARQGSLQVLITGIAGVLAAGWPFWFVGLPVDLGINSGSRFGIAFMLPASLLLAGFLGLFKVAVEVRFRRASLGIAAILALIIGLAAGQGFLDGNYFRQVHRSQAEFFQQLAWRVPQLKTGTTILVNNHSERLRSGDNALTAALNWIYDVQPPYALEYMLFYIPARIESGNLPDLKPGLTFTKQFRTTSFQGSTSSVLVVYDPYPHCLRILDPAVDAEMPRPDEMPSEMKKAILISNLDLIVSAPADPAYLSDELFKDNPGEDSWCAYFEKADLARQQGDWQTVVQLAEEAFREPHTVDNTFELLPYIEGYARVGRVDKAREFNLASPSNQS